MNLLKTLGYRFPANSPILKKVTGAKEIDIVKSGLEEIMVQATQEHWQYAQKHHMSLRYACLTNTLCKLNERFNESGMMI